MNKRKIIRAVLNELKSKKLLRETPEGESNERTDSFQVWVEELTTAKEYIEQLEIASVDVEEQNLLTLIKNKLDFVITEVNKEIGGETEGETAENATEKVGTETLIPEAEDKAVELDIDKALEQPDTIKKLQDKDIDVKLVEESLNELYADSDEETPYVPYNVKGRYVTITVVGKDLKLKLTKQGVAELKDMYREKKPAELAYLENFFNDLFDDIRSNSEYRYSPDLSEEGFGLTSAPGIIMGNTNDKGDYEADSIVWWYPNYQVASFLEDMLKRGGAIFNAEEVSLLEESVEGKRLVDITYDEYNSQIHTAIKNYFRTGKSENAAKVLVSTLVKIEKELKQRVKGRDLGLWLRFYEGETIYYTIREIAHLLSVKPLRIHNGTDIRNKIALEDSFEEALEKPNDIQVHYS